MKKSLFVVMLAFCVSLLLVFGAVPKPRKIIALTFDDEIKRSIVFGDNGLLEILRQNHAVATFFIVGRQTRSSPEIFRVLVQNGHEIENHSWGHENILKLARSRGIWEVLDSIDRTSMAMEKITGKRTHYFRPPYWASNAYLHEKIIEHGYTVMTLENPDVYSGDCEDATRHRSPEILYERVRRLIRARETRGIYAHVLVFHEKRITIVALKRLLPELAADGYNFVTVEKYFREVQAATPTLHDKK